MINNNIDEFGNLNNVDFQLIRKLQQASGVECNYSLFLSSDDLGALIGAKNSNSVRSLIRSGYLPFATRPNGQRSYRVRIDDLIDFSKKHHSWSPRDEHDLSRVSSQIDLLNKMGYKSIFLKQSKVEKILNCCSKTIKKRKTTGDMCFFQSIFGGKTEYVHILDLASYLVNFSKNAEPFEKARSL